MQIVILPANPDWPAHFAAIAAALRPALPAGALVHHIGSTAVPGLAAKEVIDIQVTVTALADVDEAALTARGLTRRPPTTDHCPPGLTLPPAELAKRLFRADAPHRANIHFRQAGRFNQRYPLLCRDYLRAHPLTAAAYATIKQNLARHFPDDAQAYYDIKDPTFDLIMAAAEPWAVATGWTLPPT